LEASHIGTTCACQGDDCIDSAENSKEHKSENGQSHRSGFECLQLRNYGGYCNNIAKSRSPVPQVPPKVLILRGCGDGVVPPDLNQADIAGYFELKISASRIDDGSAERKVAPLDRFTSKP
jgi:hypothetical protein